MIMVAWMDNYKGSSKNGMFNPSYPAHNLKDELQVRIIYSRILSSSVMRWNMNKS